MCGVKCDKLEFIINSLLLCEVDKNKNNLNKQPINSVKMMKGSLKYLHCLSILIIFISEKNDNKGGTEKLPHKIISKNKVRIGVQFNSGELKYSSRLFQNFVKEYAKKNMPDDTIPWMKIRIEALRNLLKDFKVRTKTSNVMWLMEEKAINALWSDWRRQKIALRILPNRRNIKIMFSIKGENNRLNR